MVKKCILYAAAALLLSVASCSTPKDITYFQDVVTGTAIEPVSAQPIRVRPEDKLSIIVSTPDPALSSMFNLVQTQNRVGSGSATKIGSASSTSSEGRTSLYTVDRFGDIKFPVLGLLHIAGMTRSEVASFIEKKLVEKDLVKEPIVTVEFANTGFSVMGDVNRPGRYEFNMDRLSIVDALAMAGDLTPTGRRDNITVLRDEGDGHQKTYRIDMTDMRSLSSSPVYYMQQNDVIYVEPNDKKKRETTATGNTAFTPAFWMSVGSMAITVATFIITLSK